MNEQPKEFIITEDDIQKCLDKVYYEDDDMEYTSKQGVIFLSDFKALIASSRPHPEPQAPDNIWMADPIKGCEPCKNTGCEHCAMKSENIVQHDAAIEHKAREKVLKIIAENREEIVKRLARPFSPETIKEMQEIVRKHESLRQQQGGQEQAMRW